MDTTKIVQSSKGSEVDQIAIQNNYYGITPQEAVEIATKLFLDNFPKLQKVAEDTARQRAEELCNTIVADLCKNKDVNYAAFEDPDVQYTLINAQKNYARFGTAEMLQSLSELMVKRIVQNDKEVALKYTLDKAIEVVPFLSKKHLDYLALLFGITQVHYASIDAIEKLQQHLQLFEAVFCDADFNSIYYLNMLGCLQLRLYNVVDGLAKLYNFPKSKIDLVCSPMIKKLTGDYGTSNVGSVLAVLHIEKNTPLKYSLEKWVHD